MSPMWASMSPQSWLAGRGSGCVRVTAPLQVGMVNKSPVWPVPIAVLFRAHGEPTLHLRLTASGARIPAQPCQPCTIRPWILTPLRLSLTKLGRRKRLLRVGLELVLQALQAGAGELALPRGVHQVPTFFKSVSGVVHAMRTQSRGFMYPSALRDPVLCPSWPLPCSQTGLLTRRDHRFCWGVAIRAGEGPCFGTQQLGGKRVPSRLLPSRLRLVPTARACSVTAWGIHHACAVQPLSRIKLQVRVGAGVRVRSRVRSRPSLHPLYIIPCP